MSIFVLMRELKDILEDISKIEVEITGVIFGRSTQEEIDARIKQELDRKEAQKKKEIARLQEEIERIKSL
jgi:hypothetical protein